MGKRTRTRNDHRLLSGFIRHFNFIDHLMQRHELLDATMMAHPFRCNLILYLDSPGTRRLKLGNRATHMSGITETNASISNHLQVTASHYVPNNIAELIQSQQRLADSMGVTKSAATDVTFTEPRLLCEPRAQCVQAQGDKFHHG